MAQPKVIKDLKVIKDDMGSKANLNTTDKTNLVAAINEAFQFANNGKTDIASVVGSPATAGNTFTQLKTHIQNAKNKLATNLSNVGQASVGTETLDALAAKVANAQSGVNGEVLTTGIFKENISKGDMIWVKESITSAPGPDIVPSSNMPSGIAYSADGTYHAMALYDTPFLVIHKKVGDIYMKLPNPTMMPGARSLDCGFTPDGVYLAVAGMGSSGLLIYKRDGDTFTKLADPPQPNIYGYTANFSNNGEFLAVGGANGSINIYKRSGDTFTKLTLPADIKMTGGNMNTFTWSENDNYLAGSNTTADYLIFLKRTGDSFVKLTDPSALPITGAMDMSFSKNDHIAVGGNGFTSIYKIVGDTIVKLNTTGVFTTNLTQAVTYSPDGDILYVGKSSAPYLAAYQRSGDGYSPIAAPIIQPHGSVVEIGFSKNGKYMTATTSNQLGGNHTYMYRPETGIFKSGGAASEAYNGKLGYAKEGGAIGETKQIALLWK